jgi:hypothetical protein
MMARSTRRGHHANHFDPSDFSVYMVGLARSRPTLRGWIVLAVLTGTILAFAVFVLGNSIF